MKLKLKTVLIVSTIVLTSLLGSGYWYVFVAGAPQIDAPAGEQNTGLAFQVNTLTSQAMGQERRYGVVLPPGYANHPNRQYPVIILLHGGHGTERDFEDKARLTTVLSDLYRTDRLPPAIVVTPDGSDQRGSSPLFDPEYFDGKNGKVATWIGSELVQDIQTRYRTLNQPQFWAIGGLSSGAWGAFNIGLKQLNQFHIFFGHTGYFVDRSGQQNSPQSFVHQIPPDQRAALRIYLDAGESDHKYLTATRAFHQTLYQIN